MARYFLSRERDCLQFPWGGCGGNLNNFPSRLLCLSACQPSVPRPEPGCGQQPDAGPCRDRLSRFYYDGTECRLFEYGGCAGNRNNFFTRAECNRQCGGVGE